MNEPASRIEDFADELEDEGWDCERGNDIYADNVHEITCEGLLQTITLNSVDGEEL